MSAGVSNFCLNFNTPTNNLHNLETKTSYAKLLYGKMATYITENLLAILPLP